MLASCGTAGPLAFLVDISIEQGNHDDPQQQEHPYDSVRLTKISILSRTSVVQNYYIDPTSINEHKTDFHKQQADIC